MAKGDIVAKLVLNSKDFDGKLAKSKKEISSMKGMGAQVFGGMATALKGFAVAAGAAVTVSEAFKAVIGSSQGLTDAWGRSLEATKTVFDNFVYSISNADFSSFEQGLSRMIDRAKEAYNAFDQLANTKMSTNFVMSINQAKYKAAMSRARDKNLSSEAREAAIEDAKYFMGRIDEANSKVESDSYKALKKKYSALTGVPESRITAQSLEDVYSLDARFTSDEERARIEADVEAYKNLMDKAKDAELGYYGFSKGLKWEKQKSGDYKKAESLRREAEAKYASSLVKYVAIMRLEDEELNADMQTYASAVTSSNMVSEMRTSINEAQNQINAPVKSATGGAVATPKRRSFALGKMQGYNPAMPSQSLAAGELPSTISSPFENEKIAGWADAVFFEQEIAAMDEAGKKAETLTNAFSTLGSAIGGSAGEMLNFAGSIADAIATMAPFLAYLQAEQVQRKAVANASLEQAAASAMASTAGIPFAGVALGAAAVASIIGVMKSLPMLAEGGVVTGPTVAMIGEAGKEAVIPLDKLNDYIDVAPREVRVRGEIHASGKDLVVVIDNYNKVRSVK